MIQYTVKERRMKVGKHAGKTMYYAEAQKSKVIDFEEVIRDVAEMSSLTTGDVRNAVDRLAYYLKRELTEGNTVRLGQIGTFRLYAPGRFMEHPEEVNAMTIKGAKIQFIQNRHLREASSLIKVAVDNPYLTKKKDLTATGTESAEGDGSSGL